MEGGRTVWRIGGGLESPWGGQVRAAALRGTERAADRFRSWSKLGARAGSPGRRAAAAERQLMLWNQRFRASNPLV